MQNWPPGNMSSDLVPGTKIMSLLSLTISFKGRIFQILKKLTNLHFECNSIYGTGSGNKA